MNELQALIETADSCEAMGGDLADEAADAVKAYKAVLKRHKLTLETNEAVPQKTDNIR